MAGNSKAMTVRQLMADLMNTDMDLPVVMVCENRADPHPLTGTTVASGGKDDGVTFVAHVSLVGDTRTDFETRVYDAEVAVERS